MSDIIQIQGPRFAAEVSALYRKVAAGESSDPMLELMQIAMRYDLADDAAIAEYIKYTATPPAKE